MFSKSIEQQFFESAGDCLLGSIDRQPFNGEENRGSPAIHVATVDFMVGKAPNLTKESFDGFFILQQGNDTVMISKDQIEKLVDLTK